jgi:hypothetical protein
MPWVKFHQNLLEFIKRRCQKFSNVYDSFPRNLAREDHPDTVKSLSNVALVSKKAPSRQSMAQPDTAITETFECHDYYLGRRLRFPLDQRAQFDAPLHVIAAAAARLHLPRGLPLALELPPPPSGYMRVALWPAQLQRVAIGFVAVVSHGLATAPASVDVSARTTWHWRTRVLRRVMGGYVCKIQVHACPRSAIGAARCLRASILAVSSCPA